MWCFPYPSKASTIMLPHQLRKLFLWECSIRVGNKLDLVFTGIFLSCVWLFLYLLPTACPFYRSFFTRQSTVTFTLSLWTLSPITLTLVITSLPPYWLVLRNDSMMETSDLNITFKSLDISPPVSIPSCCSFYWLFLENKWCKIYFKNNVHLKFHK